MEYRVGIIGLGYVGLPLAAESGKLYRTIGFDINSNRISELTQGIDKTLEVERDELHEAKKLTFTSESKELEKCNFYIVTVPTPIDEFKNPDLAPLKKASEMIRGFFISIFRLRTLI